MAQQQQQQRPPPRTRSSTALSSSSVSSSLPGSPGPSVSLRGLTRSSTPIATPALSVSARSSPGPPGYLTARTMSQNSSSNTSNAGPSTYKPTRPGHARDRSTSGFSVATSSASTRTAPHHNRRQQTLMGGNPNSKLSRSQLATYNSASAMERNSSGMTSPPVPDILINGAERPEDVDIASIGRLPSLSAANPMRSSPEATSIGVDGLFAKFGVKEVRSIAVRGRTKAESKREELRTMVGERYRDLLGAADSIVRMRKSSSVLLDRLGRARQECDRDAMLSRAEEQDLTRSHMLSRATTPLVSGHTPYSVATLVKLLLDCPEHIWRCIERQDYLSAARLDSVGRAVYRELVSAGKRKAPTQKSRRRKASPSDDDEDSGGYDSDEEDDEDEGLLAAFPLVEQQFDTLDGLAPQISNRATLHLRAWEVSATNVADSLATLIMLDRISMADGLQLLLDQRSKSLATLLQESNTHSAPSLRRPSAMPLARGDSASQPSTSIYSPDDVAVRDAVSRSIEALALILITHEHVKACFTAMQEDSEPLLLHLLRSLQQSRTNAAESPNTTLSMVQAQQSTARLANDPLQPILATLPNAHLFLRYLPDQILSFTPYIDIESADSHLSVATIDQKLDDWFNTALKTFKSGVSKLYATLGAAAQLAEARKSIRNFLGTRPKSTGMEMPIQIDRLHSTLDAALGARFVEIYSSKLQHIANIVPEALDGALRALSSSEEDLHPISFIFSSSLPFPSSSIFPGAASTLSMTTLGKTVAMDPFAIFKKAMQDRVSGRSPVLSGCLQQLEVGAAEMQDDMLAWLDGVSDASAREAYSSAARGGLKRIEDTLRNYLQRQTEPAQQLFIGAVAAHLALDSSFVQALLLLPSTNTLPIDDRRNLLEVEKLSKQQWCTTSVRKAVDQLRTSLRDQLEYPAPENPGIVLDPLSILVDAVNELGVHRARAIPEGVEGLLQQFETSLLSEVFTDDLLAAVKSIDQSDRVQQAKQVQSNLALLRQVLTIASDNGDTDTTKTWQIVEQSLQEIAGATDVDNLESGNALLRSQNLLAPLLFNSPHSTSRFDVGDASLLLPLGAPTPANASEGMLDLAKPGPRLALLPVNATAA